MYLNFSDNILILMESRTLFGIVILANQLLSEFEMQKLSAKKLEWAI